MKRALGVILVLSTGAMGACSSSTEDAPALSDNAAIHPAKLFTGFDDGSAEYKVPASLVGASDATTVRWTIADTNLATVDIEQPSEGQKATALLSHHAIVKTKKAGTTTLRATVAGKTFDVPLTITQYAPGARELGNDLYQENRSSMPGAGEPGTKAFGCIGCHGARGTARHSPSEIGGFDDAAILKTIATGVKPDGGSANNGNHKFVLDMTEQQGILARLRSLEPVDFPK
jgi:hypothetical protein